jgi:hypothetical protein
MKKQITCVITALLAVTAISMAATPDKDAMMAKEKAAWQAFKDKNADEFKKLLDKDIRCVYAEGIKKLQNELDDMKTSDVKSFTISDFDMFTDEPDVVVTTYTVKVEGSLNGQDISGNYNAGSVWKAEKGKWMVIFHTNMKAETAATSAASPSP